MNDLVFSNPRVACEGLKSHCWEDLVTYGLRILLFTIFSCFKPDILPILESCHSSAKTKSTDTSNPPMYVKSTDPVHFLWRGGDPAAQCMTGTAGYD